MKKKTLTDALRSEKSVPLPPKYIPKLRVRIGDDRSKKIAEFDLELPVHGYANDALLFLATEKLSAVLSRLGIFPPQITAETEHGESKKEKTGPSTREQEQEKAG